MNWFGRVSRTRMQSESVVASVCGWTHGHTLGRLRCGERCERSMPLGRFSRSSDVRPEDSSKARRLLRRGLASCTHSSAVRGATRGRLPDAIGWRFAMNAMHAVRGAGTAPGGFFLRVQATGSPAQLQRETVGEAIVRSRSEAPVTLGGHAFVGILFSAAVANSNFVGLMCIAGIASDDAPLAIDPFDRGPCSVGGTSTAGAPTEIS